MDGDEGEGLSFDDRLNKVTDALLADGEEDPASSGEPAPPGTSGTEAPKEPISGDQDKTKKVEGQEPPKDPTKDTPVAIEAPTSWPSDDKEAFKALPTWAQETIVRRENDREASFSQRSRAVAETQRVASEQSQRSQEAQSRYLGELDRLNQVASQLMPAKFADIKTEADYLNLKVKDPARASEYEAFSQILRNANAQAQQVRQQQQQQHLNKEFTTLQDKYPEFKDAAKATEIMGAVRKSLVENYGFAPQEVEIVADHRHVQIVRDAMAWRNYQASLKAAAGKKLPPQPGKNLPQRAASGASVTGEQKTNVLNRARKSGSDREKADLIASLL